MRNNLVSLVIGLALCSAGTNGAATSLRTLQPRQDATKQQPSQQNPPDAQPQKKDQQKKGQQGPNNAQQPSGQQQGAQQPSQQPSGQQQGAQQNPPTKQGDGKPAPLFGGTLNLKSSRQTQDSATLGFNGVDPKGQVQKSFLSASATGTDNAKAAVVAGYRVTDADLTQFILQGGLNQAPPAQKSAN